MGAGGGLQFRPVWPRALPAQKSFQFRLCGLCLAGPASRRICLRRFGRVVSSAASSCPGTLDLRTFHRRGPPVQTAWATMRCDESGRTGCSSKKPPEYCLDRGPRHDSSSATVSPAMARACPATTPSAPRQEKGRCDRSQRPFRTQSDVGLLAERAIFSLPTKAELGHARGLDSCVTRGPRCRSCKRFGGSNCNSGSVDSWVVFSASSVTSWPSVTGVPFHRIWSCSRSGPVCS